MMDGIELFTVLHPYSAKAEDELSLEVGQIIQVLSKDPMISGDNGWWTGN
jgi:mitogen-activated protein kinase kinase kinase 9